MSLQTLSSGEHVRREPFLTVLGTHSISRSLTLPPQRMPASPPAAPAAAGPAPHAHPAASKRSRNQTPHAHAACCVGVTLHRMRVAGILWERLAVGRAIASARSTDAGRKRRTGAMGETPCAEHFAQGVAERDSERASEREREREREREKERESERERAHAARMPHSASAAVVRTPMPTTRARQAYAHPPRFLRPGSCRSARRKPCNASLDTAATSPRQRRHSQCVSPATKCASPATKRRHRKQPDGHHSWHT